MNSGCFKKNQSPFNKGKKMTDYMSKESIEKIHKTTFKKGNLINCKPVGSERLNKKDGTISIKVGQPNKWELKHRYIWEKTFGKIPKGHIITFLDGNVLNCDIKNLKCISRAENVKMNQHHLYYKNKELTEIGINIGKIKLLISKKMKKGDKYGTTSRNCKKNK